ncbi:P-loop containing nucleoside triphosphate hydrolase protein [Phanerochaete sordida]|uniref:P-loop containing nucleoside triphosphate hydrolase protein n=1 Tax=Phanerochaete sordida TaxID=48140 RepID=A0A9P3LGM6_9APHY|nr:P-loop containing nucleoside triphosphate hydrolase protein [Phanerochaete sordida]
MSKVPCHFHLKPGGCRNGANCKFSHIDRPPNVATSEGSSTTTAPPVPPGKCIFYWRTGDCKRGFQCRYKHEQPVESSLSPPGVAAASNNADALLPFLTPAGISRLLETGSDSLFAGSSKPKTPSEVHNYLKMYLRDDYHFRGALDMHSFLALLSDATSNNVSWTTEDGQLLLSAVAKGNGLQRFNDILSCESVAVNVNNNRNILSFHRGYIVLLQYLSSDFVVKSVLSHLINALYMVFMEHFDAFSERLQTCMETIMTGTKSFKEPSMTFSKVSKNVGGAQVFGALAVVLLQCLTRIKNATAKHPKLRPLVLSLNSWIELWAIEITAAQPSFNDPLTSAPLQTREQIVQHLKVKVEQLVSIVNREHAKTERSKQALHSPLASVDSDEGVIAALHNSYVGPGELRPEGPRHDNDHVDIEDIRIAPTHEELVCRIPAFLPSTLYDAPHPAALDSPERLLDIQFRLLREELTASLRTSVQLVMSDLNSSDRNTQLDTVLQRGGGKYHGHTDNEDTVMFNVYTNAEFTEITPDRRGLSVGLVVDTPPGRARAPDANRRASFWEGMSGKRLISGGLVALVWQRPTGLDVHLGTISSSVHDHVTSAKQSASRLAVRVSLFDADIQLRILQELRRTPEDRGDDLKLLIEATVMFASVRPFLEALCVEPTRLPFSKYLVLHPPGELAKIKIDPPVYARNEGFSFELASLFPSESGVETLRLTATDSDSVELARTELRSRSSLDPSQADAIIDALTREVSLIQGPPGTGKSYTGVKAIDVLLSNKVGPILMIAFTNHALDHMLCSVLDAGITKKVVRLGSRSSDERISQFSIEAMEAVAGRSRLDRAFSENYRDVKTVEQEIRELMKECLKTSIGSEDIMDHLKYATPVFFEDFAQPPPWVHLLFTANQGEAAWTRVSRAGTDPLLSDATLYGYWLRSDDLDFLEAAHLQERNPRAANSAPAADPSADPSPDTNPYDVLRSESDGSEVSSETASAIDTSDVAESELDFDDAEQVPPEEAWMYMTVEAEDVGIADNEVYADAPVASSQPQAANPTPARPQERTVTDTSSLPEGIQPSDFRDLSQFFAFCGYANLPPVPSSDRELNVLLEHDGVWSLSRVERGRLHEHWVATVSALSQITRTEEFERLRRKHADAIQQYNEGRAAARCELLRNVDIIGCTTTGAANLTAMLETIGPRIMLVEEAGQVLEAHILGALVPSIQHVILIGDPQQLRPTINNFALSTEHKSGGKLHKFDMSLMERLSSSGFPMSQINVQRRMRPQISDLIRRTLYPKLEDHASVTTYPAVRGMHKNAFFFDHRHKENGGEDDSISKYNQFEVDMTVDLVMYLLRQGPYSAEGDIVVLCAYLGQLARMRDALAQKVAVVIDERDQRDLADREADQEDVGADITTVEHVKVTRRVRLRTIDNYQGEEAKIVILSLVRNSGGAEDDETVYGHSSKGRVNVGFLKSENRTNVALSRAREGLYILGNARDLRLRSPMWRSILSILDEGDCVGDHLPIACQRHQDQLERISKPGQLPRIAPDGGCLRQCDSRLGCGHLCPYKCHSDDPNHRSVRCEQRCTRLCPRGHPCSRPCAEPCGQCLTIVPHVELPCGHFKAQVSCFALDDLSQVRCDVRVKKKLPSCEHEADMGCSDDASQHECNAPCAGILACCGRNCKAYCHQCQGLNATTEGMGEAVARRLHRAHPCQRRLYCEHECDRACSEDHECTTECKAPCRQTCAHAHCRQPCSTPCAPCQEPCLWQCPHQKCPAPCGSVCARLPCDLRCTSILRCGHRCPSVCGEDCTIQVCPFCASLEQQDTVVDLILARTLADVDPDMEGLDDLLITLPNCRHVFTVETLDGHASMRDYYQADDEGRWTGLEAPPNDFRKPPTCPTCRTAIRSNRYGRVFKRADLDILENNVAFRMSRSLAAIGRRLEGVQSATLKVALKAEAANDKLSIVKISKNKAAHQTNQRALLQQLRSTPLPSKALDPSNGELHGVPVPEVAPWRATVRTLLTAYHDVVAVASIRSAHVHAWEASFSYLYQREMDLAAQHPESAPRNPHEHAMRMARLGVGQPQPRADRRFLVEAFWTSIHIRLAIADLAQAWCTALTSRPSYPSDNRQRWDRFISFAFRSCLQDGRIALGIAQDSESHRQIVKTSLLLMRIDLEFFRFNVEGSRIRGQLRDERNQLADRAKEKHEEALRSSEGVKLAHSRIQRVDQKPELEWLTATFSEPANVIIQEWQKLERSLRMQTFYEPVSLQEMHDIVQGLNFSHTGHFYKCPRGHTFVIGDCGGANQQAFCPECSAPIGGTGHSLISNNTRDMQYEEIARTHGAARSPWDWGV